MADIEPAAPHDLASAEQEWAQVEVFGHRRHFGRITEVERFGSKLLRIDVPTDDITVFETYFYGGGSIFSLARCTEAVARKMAYHARPQAYLPRSRMPAGMDDDGDQDPNEDGLGGQEHQ